MISDNVLSRLSDLVRITYNIIFWFTNVAQIIIYAIDQSIRRCKYAVLDNRLIIVMN